MSSPVPVPEFFELGFNSEWKRDLRRRDFLDKVDRVVLVVLVETLLLTEWNENFLEDGVGGDGRVGFFAGVIGS
jgi:hypothetical protein